MEVTLVELNAARTRADKVIDRLGTAQVSSDLNVFKNRVEYYVPNNPRFWRALRESSLELPEHVAVIESTVGPLVPE